MHTFLRENVPFSDVVMPRYILAESGLAVGVTKICIKLIFIQNNLTWHFEPSSLQL